MEESRIYPDEEIDASSENEECFKIGLDDIKKRIDVSHRYVIPESGGYILQQSEHCKSTMLNIALA